MRRVQRPYLSRRSLLLAPAAALACARQKAAGVRGYCFVANQGGRSVGVVDLNRFRLRKEIPLDAAPSAVLTHTNRGKAFVLAPDTGTVYEIDATSLSVTRRARVGNQALAMQMSSAGDALWVLYRDPAVLAEIPLDSFHLNRRIRLATPADNFDLSSDGHAAITSRQDGRIVLASLATTAIDRTIDAGSEPSIARYRNDGKHLLVGSGPERCVTIFDVPTGKTVVRLPLPIEPRNFCFNHDGGQLFVTGDGLDAIVIIFPFSTEVDETILAGHAPDAMASAELPYYLLVANPDTNTVTVLDVDTRKLVAVVQVGQEPRHILITPHGEYALVLNRQSGDMGVIRMTSLATSSDGSPRRYRSAPLFNMIPVGEKPVSAGIVEFL